MSDAMSSARLVAALLCVLGSTSGCTRGEPGSTTWLRRGAPVELPVLASDLPFHYPPGMYLQQIQDDVTLQLFIDSLGRVVAESTKVTQHAKYPAFDSAAVEGAPQLVFRPARRGGQAIAFTVLFPIKFRVPNAPPPPQDSGRGKGRR